VQRVGAIALGPGGGEQVSERVRLLADFEHVAITESVYAPGDSGPGPHIHHEHADTFYVLGGRLVFELGREAERFEAPAGTFVGAPAGIVHTFRNEGPADSRFLNFHAPGCRFGEYMRDLVAERDTSWFDSADPPADGGPPASAALYVPVGEGEREADGAGISLTWKSCRDEIALVEQLVDPGSESLPPRHDETHTTAFYVLEGTPRMRLDDDAVEPGAGTFIAVPPGVEHSFSNPGPGPVRLLVLIAPGRRDAR
jgi:mannose-6-phosphate isomerase-like protein (cupin superfamily)